MPGRRHDLTVQALLAAALLAVLWWLLDVTAANMAERGIRSGFDFLTQPAGFAIGESLLPFDSADSTGWALAAGLANTLRVALPAILVSTLLGTLLGLGRLSPNLLLRGLCAAYVETLRNVPLLLQLLAWYFVVTDLVSVANTTLNQTGRAAECIALIMAVYLILSLLTAWLSAWLERRTGRWAERS